MNETGAATANIEDLTGFDVVQVNNRPAQIDFVSNSPWNDGLVGTSFKPSIFSLKQLIKILLMILHGRLADREM